MKHCTAHKATFHPSVDGKPLDRFMSLKEPSFFFFASVLCKWPTSICFFCDSRQMPPIFRPKQENNEHSISIRDYCAEKMERVPVSVLPVTYRMNKDITVLMSNSFYEPHGITQRRSLINFYSEIITASEQ